MANLKKIKYLLSKHRLGNAKSHDYKELANLVDEYFNDVEEGYLG